jgi:Sigma-70, region 4
MTNDSVSQNADRAGLRALFEEASAGLNPSQREVIELQLCQGLEAREVATVLGVSPAHARTLLGRADNQLEACLTVLLVGRAGNDECDELGALLAGWNGQLTVALRKRAHRHIGRCATCTARRAAELRPARLLTLSPGAALAAGAESSRAALAAPSGLKAHTIALATGHGPVSVAHSAAVLARAGSFGKQGFPKPPGGRRGRGADRPRGRRRQPARSFPPGQTSAATGVMVAVTAAAVAFGLTGTSQHLLPSAYPKRHVTSAGPPTAALGDAARGSWPAPSAVQGVPVVPPAPRSALDMPGPANTESPNTGPRVTQPSVSVVPVSGDSAASAASQSTTPATESSAVQNPASGAAVPAQRAAGTGTVSALPEGGTLVAVPGTPGSLVALHATGGTVRWSASVAGDGEHAVSVTPSSGTLTPADPVATLTIKASRAVACGTDGTPRCPTVTLSPGGTRFTVWPTGTFPDVLDGRYPVDIGATLPSVTSSGTPADGTLLTRCRTVEHA